MQRRHGWTVAPEWIVPAPGIVPALYMLVRTFAAPGEKALIQTPVYYPFYSAIRHNQVEVVRNPLHNRSGRYAMDFDDLEAKLADPAVKLAILCSPHNPVGRVWTAGELRRFGELCLARGVPVVADEIHGDLILPGQRFTPFATLGEAFAQNTIVCTAPSKTFNLAGLKTANLLIPNPELRRRFAQTQARSGLFGVNAFGLVATEAAYTQGEEWLDQMLVYLDDNRRTLESFVARYLPQIAVTPLEGTYLAWLDCRRLGLEAGDLKRMLLEEARVYPDHGPRFGVEGHGFIRLNIACPRSILIEALDSIKAAVDGLSLDRSATRATR
jgi:cystathionine beta-lyase